MGFLRSYLSLPRYQRVLIGLVGVAVGWYGPDFMSSLFLRKDEVAAAAGKTRGVSGSGAHVTHSTAAANKTERN